ncbi:hypothetical protein ACFFHF_17065 [Robertmurraya beringensis]|uniref:Uncharacterized protein n=1 Tax=Robertmurraya beringensis TaxID=641660 RepID=A0ABV6KUA4_9BACI
MRLKYYVEMKDLSNAEEWSNKIDIYGYENEVTVMAMGFIKTYPITDSVSMVNCINEIVEKLEKVNCVVINREDKRAA